MATILTRRCATTCGCSANCWAKRCAATRACRYYERVERVRALAKRHAHAAAATTTSRRSPESCGRCRSTRRCPWRAASPTSSISPTSPNSITGCGGAASCERELGGRPQLASIEEALPRLLGTGVSPDALLDAVCGLRIELVITAHPTEIMRRTLQHKYNRVAAALAGRDRPDLTPTEREALLETMRREIAGAWHTEEVRRERPSPLDEVRSGWRCSRRRSGTRSRALPIARPDAAPDVTGSGLPLDAAPIRFGSWIGGDRDGNPSVTPEVTRRACADVALDGADAVRARGRDAPLRAVDGPREPRAAGPRPGRARAVSRGAA